jgi:hypothetical protein
MGGFNQGGFDGGGFNGPAPFPATPLNRVFENPSTPAATSYGQLRLLLTKTLPGIDLDLIDGWAQFAHQAVLDRLPWHRVERSMTVQMSGAYQTGTAQIEAGDTAVSITGGVFDQTFSGRQIRFENRDEYYELTATSPTTGVIDRAYEGPGGANLAYIVFATVYTLPPDCRELRGVRLLESPHPLDRHSKQEMNAFAANRCRTGKPRAYAPYMDTVSAPPLLQIEVYPAPDVVMSVAVDYIAEVTAPGASSVALLPWIRPSVLYEGVRAFALEYMKDYPGSDRAQAKHVALLQQMVDVENRNTPARQMKMESRFTRHRILRALDSQPRRGRGW